MSFWEREFGLPGKLILRYVLPVVLMSTLAIAIVGTTWYMYGKGLLLIGVSAPTIIGGMSVYFGMIMMVMLTSHMAAYRRVVNRLREDEVRDLKFKIDDLEFIIYQERLGKVGLIKIIKDKENKDVETRSQNDS